MHNHYAEDDETLGFLTRDNLEQHHYRVTHCTDGRSCLETFKAGSFDLCLFDIMLPGLDGFDL
ncbi:response regulator, partial [Salmonella enterica]|uniref:response regulator n=1 Tax=Salmonella enterica TaxID=28901 RepID=UPI0034D1CD3E